MSVRRSPKLAGRIQVHQLAVTSVGKPGDLFSYGDVPGNPGGVGLGGAAQHKHVNTVESVRLDTMFAHVKSVPFMKIDVEGGEFKVLKSAEGLLKRGALHSCVVEVRKNQGEMVQYLYDNGFTCTWVGTSIKAKMFEGKSLEQMKGEVISMGNSFADLHCRLKDASEFERFESLI